MSAELCTDLGEKIRTAVDSLRDFGPESIIIFRPDGVELVGRDHARVVDIRFLMPAEKVRATGGTYVYNSSEKEIQLGIRTKVVAAALKRFSPGDKVIIGAKKGVDREFYVCCRNKGKCFRSEIIAPMLETDTDVPVNIKSKITYNGAIHLNSGVFHNIIGDLMTADPPVISFDCDIKGKTLKLSGEGMFSKSAVEIGDSSVVGEDAPSAEFTKLEPDTKSVHENFATSYMQRISKAKGMSTSIIISVAQGAPGSFEYDTPIGLLTYLVCPRTVDDIDDPRLRPPITDTPSKKRRFTIDYGSDGMEDVE